VTATQDVDRHANELKRLRDESAWDALVQKAESYPGEVQSVPEVAQLLALALNRRGRSGDPERAIKVVSQLIERTGGDGETYGILGRIYKDRYERNKSARDFEAAARDLEAAIEAYRTGFEKQPDDYYPGVNVVTLLLQRHDEEARRELEEILPRVKEAVRKKLEASSTGFWELATALHLAAVSREWEQAEGFLEGLLTPSTPQWMVETTARDLTALEPSMENQADRERLRGLIGRLRNASPSGEGRYA
jgi:tetratricopeptide (TPR) repeat protein